MNDIIINQSVDLILTKKSISWLIEEDNTFVKVFDPVSFNGYQRQIDEHHCKRIVEYIKNNDFLLPSAIICACNNYTDGSRLAIVDGQHRVKAFQMLNDDDPNIFDKIKDKELPIIVLNNANLKTEIDTFININKKSRKVDTSLAYVLKSQISRADGTDNPDLAMPKSEYISVETARKLSFLDENRFWYNRILFEGTVRNTDSFISLNMFVTTARVLVNTLEKKKIISFDWADNNAVEDTINTVSDFVLFIWEKVYQKWPKLYDASIEEKQILQGSIGFASITRTIIKVIRANDKKNIDETKQLVEQLIFSFNIDESKWMKNGIYSKYSSGSGIKIISDELLNSINDDDKNGLCITDNI